ncbi:MAG: NUDIX hydrolase [Deltaproteobacteria bacterium]
MEDAQRRHFITQIEKIIASSRAASGPERAGGFVYAAVMLILREEGGKFSMLFIKRPESAGDVFSGHMAFPGGKIKLEDGSLEDTALRETLEETGVNIRQSGRILGELEEFRPVNPQASHYIVTPYLALLTEAAEIKPNEAEVADFVWIPVLHLSDERNHEARFLDRHGERIEDHVYRYGNYVIWGMTGRILYRFLSAARHVF